MRKTVLRAPVILCSSGLNRVGRVRLHVLAGFYADRLRRPCLQGVGLSDCCWPGTSRVSSERGLRGGSPIRRVALWFLKLRATESALDQSMVSRTRSGSTRRTPRLFTRILECLAEAGLLTREDGRNRPTTLEANAAMAGDAATLPETPDDGGLAGRSGAARRCEVRKRW